MSDKPPDTGDVKEEGGRGHDLRTRMGDERPHVGPTWRRPHWIIVLRAHTLIGSLSYTPYQCRSVRKNEKHKECHQLKIVY